MISRPKGTNDLLPTESQKFVKLTNFTHKFMKKYNVEFIRTPIFESYELFHRNGELSDMVTKETYDFLDRANRKLTLRPEGTAGIVRSYVENKIFSPGHFSSYYYIGPFFRYERPQKNRYREFYQIGAELIGNKHFTQDAELISMAYNFLKGIGIEDFKLKINYLGNHEELSKFKIDLSNYLKPLKESLSKESQLRIEKNPLRILDSKSETDRKLLINAPKTLDYISQKQAKEFQQTLKILDKKHISYEIDHTLVRGIDYYSEIVFEFQTSELNSSSHNAVGGGGRYNDLVNELGGPKVSGVGFAFGVERLLNLKNSLNSLPENIDIFLTYIDDVDSVDSYIIFSNLRMQNFKVYFGYKSNTLKTEIKNALGLGSKYLLIFDSKTSGKGIVQVRNLQQHSQVELKYEELDAYLRENLEVKKWK